MENIETIQEMKEYIQLINNIWGLYFKHGPRSSKKVDYFHNATKEILERYFTSDKGFDIKLEQNINALNKSKRKKCDIVIFKNKEPYIIFPVKIIMTNYKQNANNYFENLTGELVLIKMKNKNTRIIPINIFMNKTPYLKKNRQIARFETIEPETIEHYNELKNIKIVLNDANQSEPYTKNVCYDIINYIVEVKHINNVGEEFVEIQSIEKFITPYRSFRTIINELL